MITTNARLKRMSMTMFCACSVLMGSMSLCLANESNAVTTPVYTSVYEDTIYRTRPTSVYDPATDSYLESFEKMPCGYPPEHEAVLKPVVNMVWKEGERLEIWNLGNTPVNESGTPESISCGRSAREMMNRSKPLLPEGWSCYRVNSVDVFGFIGSTSHTQFAVEAPDGTVYLMDAYFGGPEITKMKKFGSGEDEYYEPDEQIYCFSGISGYTDLWKNTRYRWVKDSVDGQSTAPVKDPRNEPKKDPKDELLAAKKSLLKVRTRFSSSFDPNDLYGNSGVGDERYIPGGSLLNYTVTFENVATAGLPAADVVVTNHLDPAKFDLSTFSLGALGFGSRTITPPQGLKAYTTDVDLRPAENLAVRVTAALDAASGDITWTFNTLDPVTLKPPADSTLGFLPPNVTSPEGEGFCRYTVTAKSGLSSGARLECQANIVFDANAPILTPTWLNTIDVTLPTSKVSTLSATQNRTLFSVSWTGSDANSGVSKYSVYYSAAGGDWEPWLTGTDKTTAQFLGEKGKSYAFYSVGEDSVGNMEAAPTSADATTTVSATADEVAIDASSLYLVSSSEVSPGIWQYVLKFNLKNASSVGITGATAQMQTLPSGLTATDGVLTFGSVASGATAQPSDTITIQTDHPELLVGVVVWNVAFQAMGAAQTYSLSTTLEAASAAAPSVAVTFPTSDPACSRNCDSVVVSGTSTDDLGVTSVTYSVNGGAATACTGTNAWSTGTITLGATDTVVVVTARDAAGHEGTDQITLSYVDAKPDSAWSGMALVSLPIVPDKTDPKQVVDFVDGTWFAFNPTANAYAGYSDHASWFEPVSATPGRAFWATFDSTSAGECCGTIPPQNQPAAIHLKIGWNLIGTPFVVPVTWDLSAIKVRSGSDEKSLADARAAGWTADFAWGWKQNATDPLTGSYELVYDSAAAPGVTDTLQPWFGYWFLAYQDCDMVIPAP